MAINTQELVKELQVRHQVGLKPNDPIFVLLTMNELLLANYQEQFQALLEVQGKQQDIQTAEAIKSHLQESTNLSNRLLKALHEVIGQCQIDLGNLFQNQLHEIRTEKNQCGERVQCCRQSHAELWLSHCALLWGYAGLYLSRIFAALIPIIQ